MERFFHERGSVITELQNNPELIQLSKLGYCRFWTKAAADALRNKFPGIFVEAREVEIVEELCHTFLKVKINNDESLLCDGVGVGKNPPFFGSEAEAPKYLRNSKPDIINRFIFLDNTYHSKTI